MLFRYPDPEEAEITHLRAQRIRYQAMLGVERVGNREHFAHGEVTSHQLDGLALLGAVGDRDPRSGIDQRALHRTITS